MAEPRPVRCPVCGAGFSCGVDTDSCWCQTVPVDPAALHRLAEEHDGCLCPSCLRRLEEQARQEASAG
jgi:hypothetical protein